MKFGITLARKGVFFSLKKKSDVTYRLFLRHHQQSNGGLNIQNIAFGGTIVAEQRCNEHSKGDGDAEEVNVRRKLCKVWPARHHHKLPIGDR